MTMMQASVCGPCTTDPGRAAGSATRPTRRPLVQVKSVGVSARPLLRARPDRQHVLREPLVLGAGLPSSSCR